MVDNKHFQGYSNWASFSFSVVWSNDEDMYNDFVEKAAGGYLEHKWDHTEMGRTVVEYAREHYTGRNPEASTENRFPDLVTDEEWGEIDLAEVGEELREAITAHGRYAHLLDI